MSCRTALAALLACSLLVEVGRAEPPKAEPTKHPANHLARESSPYLLQHAHNPVDWYPWGTEAFDKARKEKKLIFLSIGYSSCHWCHVMERESFSNEDVARLMNEHFVCIKVDREERPDVDQIYMTALSVQGQSGGWPLSMFLTPEGKPIVGGTYWPPDDKEVDGETVRGFKTLLKIVHKFHAEKPEDIQKQADSIAAATTRALARTAPDLDVIERNWRLAGVPGPGAGMRAGGARIIPVVPLDRALVSGAVEALQDEFDKAHGGFGSRPIFRGPKFPMPPSLRLVQHEAERTRSADLDEVLRTTLDHMARGGIYDHLGGGFHRYSTERTWTVPHFEKMLYDNAQLVEVYSHAYRMTKDPVYKRVVQETLAFVERELTSPEGAFYSALDADAEGEEGRFYVWTSKQLASILGDPADVRFFKKVYGADGEPNFEQKYHILLLPKSLAERAQGMGLTGEQLEARLAPLRQKLFAARAKRARPLLDTKVLTSWNGEMIAGYAIAGQVLGEPKYLDSARRAAGFLLKELRTRDGRLLRTYGAAPGARAQARLNAYLDDYAYLVHGLLCLHDATREQKWLDEARALTDLMVKYHADVKGGGFFFTSSDHEKLFARAKDQHDGAQPSGNSLAAQDLVRLWRKTGDERYRVLAEKTFRAFAVELDNNPSGLPALAQALAMYLDVQDSKRLPK